MPVPGAGTGSFKRIEATAPPRQWPGHREMSLFWLYAASHCRADVSKSWSYFSRGDGVWNSVIWPPCSLSGPIQSRSS